MAPSPTLDRFLAGMEYPATRDDLLREAARDGLPPSDVRALAALADQSYGARWMVRRALASADRVRETDPTPAPAAALAAA